MNTHQKVSLFALRVGIGIIFLYAGISKLLVDNWSAAGYLNSAQTFSGLYHWFASSGNIGWINFVNVWGQILIGAGLISGFLTRWASWAGIVMMVLYYFPTLNFPYVGDHSYLVDEHIIYILVLLVLTSLHAGRYIGIDGVLKSRRDH
jgi:thiosulfate dehydrogenase [quinone] large subunit